MAGSDRLWRMLSRTAEYALRSVLHLARRPEGATAAEIAAATGIPAKYLGQVLSALAQAGVLWSSRGSQGGYRLLRDPAEIALAEVIAPFDAVGSPAQCLLRDQQCGVGEPCVVHAEWHRIAADVREFFRTMTLAELLAVESRDGPAAVAATRDGAP